MSLISSTSKSSPSFKNKAIPYQTGEEVSSSEQSDNETTDDTSDIEYETVPSGKPMPRKHRSLVDLEQVLKKTMASSDGTLDIEEVPACITTKPMKDHLANTQKKQAGEGGIKWDEKSLEEEELSEGDIQFCNFVRKQVADNINANLQDSETGGSSGKTLSRDPATRGLGSPNLIPTRKVTKRRTSLVAKFLRGQLNSPNCGKLDKAN